MSGLNVTNVTEPNEPTSGKPLTQSTLPTVTACPCEPTITIRNISHTQRIQERLTARLQAAQSSQKDIAAQEVRDE